MLSKVMPLLSIGNMPFQFRTGQVSFLRCKEALANSRGQCEMTLTLGWGCETSCAPLGAQRPVKELIGATSKAKHLLIAEASTPCRRRCFHAGPRPLTPAKQICTSATVLSARCRCFWLLCTCSMISGMRKSFCDQSLITMSSITDTHLKIQNPTCASRRIPIKSSAILGMERLDFLPVVCSAYVDVQINFRQTPRQPGHHLLSHGIRQFCGRPG